MLTSLNMFLSLLLLYFQQNNDIYTNNQEKKKFYKKATATNLDYLQLLFWQVEKLTQLNGIFFVMCQCSKRYSNVEISILPFKIYKHSVFVFLFFMKKFKQNDYIYLNDSKTQYTRFKGLLKKLNSVTMIQIDILTSSTA